MDYHVHPSTQCQSVQIDTIPGDKSISHRAIILGALCSNTSIFTHFLTAEDCLNTVEIFRQLGVQIDRDDRQVMIRGVGMQGLAAPRALLDCGNSGTGIRLITGVLAGQSFDATISGDASIQRRPMRRVISPLAEMGAIISGQTLPGKTDIFPPLRIQPSSGLSAIRYTLPVASAQVKSAVMLAGLFADGTTTVIEPEKCRDHTEQMLKGFGAHLLIDGIEIHLTPSELKNPNPDVPIRIPADFSSAAFFMVLGVLSVPLTLTGIGLNRTRDALLHVLHRMGANITIVNRGGNDFEPYGDIVVAPSELTNTELLPEEIPFIIDEIPILAIAALFAKGTLKVRNADELRVKESDRIAAIVSVVRSMGGTIREFDDGFEIDGNATIHPFRVASLGDHRIAMSAIIGATAARVEATVENCDCINTSFPNFFAVLHAINGKGLN